MERYFVRILQQAVEGQSALARVRYVTPGEHSPRVRIFHGKGSSGNSDSEKTQEITFQVNTPTFYSRFAHYQTPYSALEGELLDDERTRTTWCTAPEEFVSLFHIFDQVTIASPYWRWRLLEKLRCPPEPKNYDQNKPYQSFTGLSAMDCWVLQNCTESEQRDYRRSAIRIYLGERFGGVVLANGAHPELLGVSRDGVLRIYEAWAKGLVALVAVYSSYANSLLGEIAAIVMLMSINVWACLKMLL